MSARAGDRFYAGMGVATVLPDCDFETRSAAGYVWNDEVQKWKTLPGATKKGLSAVAARAYAEHPTTDVQWFAYDLKDGHGVRQWVPGQPAPRDMFEHLAAGGLMEAHNNMFERLIWRFVMSRRYGWPEVPAAQWRCSMAKARAFALPGALGLIGGVLRLPIQKDKEGEALIKFFAMPRDPTKPNPKVWNDPAEYPEHFARYGRYNAIDIQAEAEVSIRCPDLEGEEFEFWQADQAINWRGVHIDLPGVKNCISIIDQAHISYNAELQALTGGTVRAASELAKLKGWLGAHGVHMGDGPGSMDDEAIGAVLQRAPEESPPEEIQRVLDAIYAEEKADAIAAERGHYVSHAYSQEEYATRQRAMAWKPTPPLPAAARRALEIRQAIGSASVKKVYAMANQVSSENRLHDLFSYHAARTGRPTGNGPQPTNLPKAGPTVYLCGCTRHSADAAACRWCGVPRAPGSKPVEWSVDAVEDALAVIALRDLRTVEHYFGDAMLAVSGSLRGLFTAAPFYDLIASDYSAIEAVVLAALAGEEWRLDVFRARRDIYLESAATITRTPLQVYHDHKKQTGQHHPHRQKVGKVAELASGFGGWIGAWRAFGAEGTDDEIKAQIVAWREASPAIVEFWGGQSRDFGRRFGMFGLEGAAVQAVQDRGVRYPVARMDGTLSGVSYEMRDDALYCQLPSGRYLTYHRPRLVDSGTWRGQSLSFEGYNTNPKAGAMGWIRMQTYSGKLAENVTQAVARDIQRHAIVNLEKAGYPVVLHVYDEDVSEIPQGWGSIEEFESIMNTMPAWAQGWPIRASGGWRGRRYRKG